MEQNDRISEELQVSELMISRLNETARWARFLSIVGFVMVALFLLGAFMLPRILSETTYSDGTLYTYTATGVTINFIIMAILLFFPCLFLFRFATRVRYAMAHHHQGYFENAFDNLKSTFKFYGILTIIVLGIYALAFVLVAIVALMQIGGFGF